MKRGDHVKVEGFEDVPGIVIRVAKDGTWADVRWQEKATGEEWTKRMLCRHLTVPQSASPEAP